MHATSPPTLTLHALAHGLAELTAMRDRGRLQRGLVQLLLDLCPPQAAWLCQRAEGPVSPLRWEIDALGNAPAPDEDPLVLAARHEALHHERRVQLAGAPWRELVPLVTDRGTDAVLELLHAAPPPAGLRPVADELLRSYRHLVGLLDYSERDSLTGLLNRKTFDETFMRQASPAPADTPVLAGDEGRRHWHSSDPCYLAVIDVDHFKRINDSFGHLVGDEVLLLLAQLMHDTFRSADRLYRFGGEEFVVLMRCSGHDGAVQALERLRQRVAGHSFPQAGHLTISAGLTCIDPDDTPELAFGRADKAVYAAKARGRDQVCEFSSLAGQGAVADAPAVGMVDFF